MFETKPLYNKTLYFVINYYNKVRLMVQAIINLGEREDRILTIIRGKFGIKNKSEAVNFVIGQYEQELLEPELRPEYVEKLEEIRKGKYIKYNSLEELRKATN